MTGGGEEGKGRERVAEGKERDETGKCITGETAV